MDNYHTIMAMAASNKPMHFHFLKREVEREGEDGFVKRVRALGDDNGTRMQTEVMISSLKVRGVWGYREVKLDDPNFKFLN